MSVVHQRLGKQRQKANTAIRDPERNSQVSEVWLRKRKQSWFLEVGLDTTMDSTRRNSKAASGWKAS